MSIPRLSVIVTLYNKAPSVRKAVESIAFQTYKNWELIIVDDGSTDGSADIVRDFIRANDRMSCADALNEPHPLNDGKIRLITQTNAGVAAARNRGAKESRGEYLCFLDADDWWEPTFLEEIDKLMAEYPDAGIYATNYVYYKPGKTHVALTLSRGYLNYPQAYMDSTSMPVTSITTCMPRNVFDEMGGFPVGIKLGEDFLLWAKTAIHYKVAFCEKPLAYYNNDVPASLRATRNLYAPEYNMLFNLESLESEIRLNGENGVNGANGDDWKALLDWLRVYGLLEYWLDSRYHDAAAGELHKVDWSKQPKTVMRLYKTPIWILKTKRGFMRVGSYWKQKLLKMCYV